MIPKIIWQTHEPDVHDLTPILQQHIGTWKTLNPEYKHAYMNATEREEFVQKNFSRKIFEIYVSLPLNIMRADMWRLLVTYFYGGIYVDSDSRCNSPIDSWMPDGKSFVVGAEHGDSFVTSTFACSPKHPIMAHVVKNMIKNLESADYSLPHIVHRYTGPWVFSRYVLEFIGVKPHDLSLECSDINLSPGATKHGFYMFCGNEYDMFTKIAITHFYGDADISESGHPYWAEHELCKNDLQTVNIHASNREWRGW
jgi:mannosyltransferase OCH1-like enzyme